MAPLLKGSKYERSLFKTMHKDMSPKVFFSYLKRQCEAEDDKDGYYYYAQDIQFMGSFLKNQINYKLLMVTDEYHSTNVWIGAKGSTAQGIFFKKKLIIF